MYPIKIYKVLYDNAMVFFRNFSYNQNKVGITIMLEMRAIIGE